MHDAIGVWIVVLIAIAAIRGLWQRRNRQASREDEYLADASKRLRKWADQLTLMEGRNTWDPSHPQYHRHDDE